jgi:hypothetical protein
MSSQITSLILKIILGRALLLALVQVSTHAVMGSSPARIQDKRKTITATSVINISTIVHTSKGTYMISTRTVALLNAQFVGRNLNALGILKNTPTDTRKKVVSIRQFFRL